jgi:exo-beta-1,3-glucanase (GH17 family)
MNGQRSASCIDKLMMLAVMLLVVTLVSLPADATEAVPRDTTFIKRAFNPVLDGRWIGNGIAYGAYRDGESPDLGSLTSRENILEDRRLITKRWQLIRLYDAGQQSLNILRAIRDARLPVRIMLGAWVSGKQTPAEDQAELDRLIGLANRFPETVVAVNVGNEILVDWSEHRIDDIDRVVEYIRHVRGSIRQPVTVSDDYNFWNKQYAGIVAHEVDFIGLHAYAFWNNQPLEQAMDWTNAIYRDIQKRFPAHRIVLGETGWPTSRVYDTSYEGRLIGKAGDAEQKAFFNEYTVWVNSNRVISFYFEAFDEQWKGGDDGENPMAKAEKHWGLYRSDRTPKKVLH